METYENRPLALWAAALLGAALGACVGWLGHGDALTAGALVAASGWEAFAACVGTCFLRAGVWVAAAFLLGFTALLAPVVWALPLLRALGIALACAVALRGENGVFLAALRVLLPGVLHLYLLVQCCGDALEQSAFLRGCLRGTPPIRGEGLRGYLLRYAAWFALTLFVSTAEAGAAVAAGLL